jgi:hypothetical protein
MQPVPDQLPAQFSTSPRLAPPLSFVRNTSPRTLVGFPFVPRSGFVCPLCHRYHPDRRGLIASEHRAWPLVTSFSPLYIYVAPQHLVVTAIHRAGPTGRFRRLRTRAMQHPAFRLRSIHLLRGWVNRPQLPLTRHASSKCSLSRSPCLVRTVLQDLAVSATLPMTSNSLLY